MVKLFKELKKNDILIGVSQFLSNRKELFTIDDSNFTITKGRYGIGLQFEFWDGNEYGDMKRKIDSFAGVSIWVFDSNDDDKSFELMYFDGDDFSMDTFETHYDEYVELSYSLNTKLGVIEQKITEIYEYAKINEIENNLVDELFCKVSQIYE